MDSIQVWRKDLQDYLRQMLRDPEPLDDLISQLLAHAAKDVLIHARPVAVPVPPPCLTWSPTNKVDLNDNNKTSLSQARTWTMTEAIAHRLDTLPRTPSLPLHKAPWPHTTTPLLFDTLFWPLRSSSYPSKQLTKWTLHDRARFLPMIKVQPWRPSVQQSKVINDPGANPTAAVAIDTQVQQRLVALDREWNLHFDPMDRQQQDTRSPDPPTFEFATLVQVSPTTTTHVNPVSGLERTAHQGCVAHNNRKRKISPRSRFSSDTMRFSATQKVSDFVALRKSSTSSSSSVSLSHSGESSSMY